MNWIGSKTDGMGWIGSKK